MDGVKSEAFALKTTYAAARSDMLLADKDAIALPGQQPPAGEATHSGPNNYDIISVFEFCYVTALSEPLRILSPCQVSGIIQGKKKAR